MFWLVWAQIIADSEEEFATAEVCVCLQAYDEPIHSAKYMHIHFYTSTHTFKTACLNVYVYLSTLRPCLHPLAHARIHLHTLNHSRIPGREVDNTLNHCQVDKLFRDVRDGGLGLLVLAEWFNSDVMQKIRFFDDNTSELFCNRQLIGRGSHQNR